MDEAGIPYTVRRYLDDPPTAAELTDVLTRLNLDPWHLVRMNEPEAEPLRSPPRDEAHQHQWIDAMVTSPILIQRLILTTDDGTTTIARNPETLRRLLNQ
jgi:arsenate reductase